MENLTANLSLEYIEDPFEHSPRTITIYCDENIIVDKKDLSEKMDFCLTASTIKIVIESIKNKSSLYKFYFYLLVIFEGIFNSFGL
ncbi:hypothetical protein [Paenibacillus sp. ATY16]|uniref:hypothetical protein n=1 Tax=Paenibacillus sp. ATY16 TaxID=1759312 RepID=UPI000E2FA9D6|nr:hypothetical protein [Paenibacillus sp. ATY16]MCK9861798.1 hypothetical protein [Paenibacillus sp. ATY16]